MTLTIALPTTTPSASSPTSQPVRGSKYRSRPRREGRTARILFDQVLSRIRAHLLRARDTHARHQIHEAARIPRYEFEPALCAGRRGQKHGIKSRCPATGHVRLGFLDAQIRQKTAVDPAGTASRRSFEPVSHHRVQIRKEQKRDFGASADFRGDFEHLVQRRAGLKSAVGGTLNYGTVGDGSEKGTPSSIRSAPPRSARGQAPRFSTERDRPLSGTRSAPAGLRRAFGRTTGIRFTFHIHFGNILAVDVGIFIASAGEVDGEDLTFGVGRPRRLRRSRATIPVRG